MQHLPNVGRYNDIRPVNESDLLGRHPADIDPAAVAAYITGRRVLVTGAGGSIGSELCRQLVWFDPASLVMSTATRAVCTGRSSRSRGGRCWTTRIWCWPTSVTGRGSTGVRRPGRSRLPRGRPQAPPVLPDASRTKAGRRTCGARRTVLEAAERHGVASREVSTDKAADPTTVLGWTKRITERLTAQRLRDRSVECRSVQVRQRVGLERVGAEGVRGAGRRAAARSP